MSLLPIYILISSHHHRQILLTLATSGSTILLSAFDFPNEEKSKLRLKIDDSVVGACVIVDLLVVVADVVVLVVVVLWGVDDFVVDVGNSG